MSDSGDPSDSGEEPAGGQILDREEIDSLLGADGSAGGEDEASGIERIVSAGLVAYERLPMLEIVFDRLMRILSTSLRNFTSDNVDVSIDSIVSLRFGDYLNSVPLPAMLAVFKVEQWDNYGLLVVDSSLIYSVVDVLLGGRRGTAAMRIEGRPYTTIERVLVERLIMLVLQDLSDAFSPLSPATFRFERLEVNPRFAAVSRLSNACILSIWKIVAARSSCCCLMRPWSRSANCCCSNSWVRNSAVTRSGRPTSPKSYAIPKWPLKSCWTNRRCRSPPSFRCNQAIGSR